MTSEGLRLAAHLTLPESVRIRIAGCPDLNDVEGVVFPDRAAMVASMMAREVWDGPALPGPSYLPAHVPSGAALLAVQLSEEARGIRGLDLLRRSIDRAPPVRP